MSPEPGQYSVNPSIIANSSIEVANSPTNRLIESASVIEPRDYTTMETAQQREYVQKQKTADIANFLSPTYAKIDELRREIAAKKEISRSYENTAEYKSITKQNKQRKKNIITN